MSASGLVLTASEPAARPARLSDVEAMADIINGYAARGLMLPKAPAELHRLFREYVVVADGERVVACGGLRVYSPALAEIVGLAVVGGQEGRGLGRRVVSTLLDEARALALARVFAMTLQEGFFHRMGFRTTSLKRLPEKTAADCRGCARRAGCREIAVVLDLVPRWVRASTGRRALAVLQDQEAAPS
ncbi:MAG: GNAT family N-acetyltransferase [Gemmatimonadetes bacterium]|nr:GNAT family N-acetyltransferase [Gemmatimonadota bacterium]